MIDALKFHEDISLTGTPRGENVTKGYRLIKMKQTA
jgi:hypothetical protein